MVFRPSTSPFWACTASEFCLRRGSGPNFPKYADPDPHPCRKLMFFLLFRGGAASGVWGGRTHESASGLRQNKWMAFISSKILWTLLRLLQVCDVPVLRTVSVPYIHSWSTVTLVRNSSWLDLKGFALITKKKIFYQKTYVFWNLYRTKDIQAPRDASSPIENTLNMKFLLFSPFLGTIFGLPGYGLGSDCHGFVSPCIGGYSNTYAATNQHAEIDEEGEEVGRSVVTKLLYNGSLTRDFQLVVFCMNQCPPCPGVFH